MTGLLSPAQRNSLTIGLRIFETDLRQAKAWMQVGAEPEQGVLYRRSLRLAPEQRAAMLEQIEAALQQIGRLAAQFELAAAEQDLAAVLAARMSVGWATLVDLQSARLGRYGPVSPGLAESLDPALDALLQAALALAALAGEAATP